MKALEGKKVSLPVRLTGEGPWTVVYEYPAGSGGATREETKTIRNANDFIEASNAGTYKLHAISDSVCPGSVDTSADVFGVSWLDKPKLHVTESDRVSAVSDTKYIKEAVCEGDEDSLDLSFSGTTCCTSPFGKSLIVTRLTSLQTRLRRASATFAECQVYEKARSRRRFRSRIDPHGNLSSRIIRLQIHGALGSQLRSRSSTSQHGHRLAASLLPTICALRQSWQDL